MKEFKLTEVDKLEVTVLIDNYTDALLLLGTEVVKRPLQIRPPKLPLAEHGFSCLIKVYSGSEKHVVLMDTGVSATCLFYNSDVLGIDLSEVTSIILSHGDFDHFGGLKEFLMRAGKKIDLTLHPDAFLQRRLNIAPIGLVVDMPQLDEEELRLAGAVMHKNKEASVLASGLILASGEVSRVTDFEKGFPWAEAKNDDKWVANLYFDDQGVAVNVKDKGLVIIGGCSHAGIINTIKHIQKVTAINKIHAVMGGFHLTGPVYEPIIGATIEEMKRIGPDFVVPMHCTGWKAVNQFADQMPQQFLLNTVGTTYVFGLSLT